jgi:hypothetical protein
MSELKVDKVSPRTGTYVSLNTVGMKNIIINGDMSLAQRGTSEASITTSGYYTVDRFKFFNSSLGTFTMSQSTDVPTGQGFATSLKLDCTTADAAPAAADNLRIQQIFEGQNLQYLKKGTANALSTTLSFWVKSTKTGTFIAELYDLDNSRQISKSYTVDVTNTWEKKTITFEGDTTGALDNDNQDSLSLNLWLGAGTDYTSGTLSTTWTSVTTANRAVGQVNIADDTANDFYITGVQLEAGTTASDFEFLPVDVNLGRCRRYFQNYYYLNGTVICIANSHSTTQASGGFDINLPMRSAPTITLPATGRSGATITFLTAASGYPTTDGTIAAVQISKDNFRFHGTGFTGLTNAGVSWLYPTSAVNILLDAEL